MATETLTLSALLGKERERTLQELTRARTPEKADQVLRALLERLHFGYAEGAKSEEARTLASAMLASAGTLAGLLLCFGEVRVWERGGSEAAKRHLSPLGIIFILPGVAAVLFACYAALGYDYTRISPKGAGILAAGMLLVLLGGFILRGRAPAAQKKEQMTEVFIDPEATFRTLSAAVLVMDRELAESAARAEEKSAREADDERRALGPEIMGLFGALLEAEASEDGELALARVQDVRHYLHTHGIRAVDYGTDTARYFDVLPGETTRTVRPALLAGGELLSRGLATGGA